MAKASFHKNQKVFVKPVGTWAIVERVLPQWVKGLDEPLKVHYDVGLGPRILGERADRRQVRRARSTMSPISTTGASSRARNRWADTADVPNHPFPGSYPVVTTDDKNWGGWRVPSAEYDRDPQKIEFQARIIAASPHLMRIAKALAQFGAQPPRRHAGGPARPRQEGDRAAAPHLRNSRGEMRAKIAGGGVTLRSTCENSRSAPFILAANPVGIAPAPHSTRRGRSRHSRPCEPKRRLLSGSPTTSRFRSGSSRCACCSSWSLAQRTSRRS